MDPKPPSESTSPKRQVTAQSSIKDEAINSHHSSDAVSSQVSNSTHESIGANVSQIQSPPIQVMERPDDFDFSNRFSSSSSSSKWSSASDESLFSIHITNSYRHDQAQPPEQSSQIDVGSLKAESLSKLDTHVSDLDEPQKIVRWKTQVEHLADEGISSQDQRLESFPLTEHKSSEPKYEASLLCVAETSFVGQNATVGHVSCQSVHVGMVAGKT
ncbi:hypothetical protein QVD17_35505 [Tagetes erecta]|uniref:Uncharacterized protein n=1 Tax=Tagetes erecta TaxID=13708 RepID=A0AAD8K3Q5_TARER|nr:hypothetical protein QVD17_35505 [Tagetes erecta]